MQENSGSALEATQGGDAAGGKHPGLWWAEASIWTERMKSALGNGVKGGKWFSLMDKVSDPRPWKPPGIKSRRTRGRRGSMVKVSSGSRRARSLSDGAS